MPTYPYRCRKCKKEFEAFNRIAERHDQRCLACGSSCEVTPPHTRAVTFRGGYFEHIGPDGVHVETAQELREACVKHEAYST